MKNDNSIVRNFYFKTKSLFDCYVKSGTKQCWNFSNFFFFCKADKEDLQNFKRASFNLFFIKNSLFFLFRKKLNLSSFVINDVLIFCCLSINDLLRFYSLYYNKIKIVYFCTATSLVSFSTMLYKIKQLNKLVNLLSQFKASFFFRDIFSIMLQVRQIIFIVYLFKLKFLWLVLQMRGEKIKQSLIVN